MERSPAWLPWQLPSSKRRRPEVCLLSHHSTGRGVGRNQREVPSVLFHPGGMSALSRWLSAATPPELGSLCFRIPEGCQKASHSGGIRPRPGAVCHPSGMGQSEATGVRWCRYAQPPANRYDPCRGRMVFEATSRICAACVDFSHGSNSESEALWID